MIKYFKSIGPIILKSTSNYKVVIAYNKVGLIVINSMDRWRNVDNHLNCLHRWRGAESRYIRENVDYEINGSGDCACIIDGIDEI
jgi:hypothetical protein